MKIELEFRSALSSPPERSGRYLYWDPGIGFVSDVCYSAEHEGWNMVGDDRSHEFHPDDNVLWAVLDTPKEEK